MSIREEANKALSAYRSSWIDLGRLLNEIAYGGDYKEWGYDDFEVYYTRELGLKKATVQKLMVSYNYMKKYQKKKLSDLEQGKPVVLPSFEAVAAIDKAVRDESASEEMMNEMKFQAFSQPITDDTAREVKRKIPPRKPVDPDRAEKAAVLRAARTLRKTMNSSHFVPDGLKERIEGPLVELEGLA